MEVLEGDNKVGRVFPKTRRKPMTKKALSRKEFLALPLEQRRKLLEAQANNPELIAYYKGLEPKADEGLLTPKRIKSFYKEEAIARGYGSEEIEAVANWVKPILEAQQALSRAECQELLTEQRRYFESKITEAKEVVRVECQKRIDSLLEEIETKWVEVYGKVKPRDLRDDPWWQSLKEKYQREGSK